MEERLIELEIRLALQDQALEELTRTVALQQQQISYLQQELGGLAQHLQSLDSISKPSLIQEIPPHY